MAAHTQIQKQFIVRCLARLYTYGEIAGPLGAFAREFPDTSCTVEDIRAIDPDRGCIDAMLCAAHAAVRAEFLARPAPISQKAVRLAEWQLIFNDAKERRAYGLMQAALVGAAAETAASGGEAPGT